MRDVSTDPQRRLRRLRLAGRRWQTSWPIMESEPDTTKQPLTLDYSVIPANKVNPISVGFSQTELWRTKTSSVLEQTLSTASKEKADESPYLSVSKRRLSSLLHIFFSCIIRFCNFPQLCIEFSFPFYIVLVMFKLKIYSHSLLS